MGNSYIYWISFQKGLALEACGKFLSNFNYHYVNQRCVKFSRAGIASACQISIYRYLQNKFWQAFVSTLSTEQDSIHFRAFDEFLNLLLFYNDNYSIEKNILVYHWTVIFHCANLMWKSHNEICWQVFCQRFILWYVWFLFFTTVYRNNDFEQVWYFIAVTWWPTLCVLSRSVTLIWMLAWFPLPQCHGYTIGGWTNQILSSPGLEGRHTKSTPSSPSVNSISGQTCFQCILKDILSLKIG